MGGFGGPSLPPLLQESFNSTGEMGLCLQLNLMEYDYVNKFSIDLFESNGILFGVHLIGKLCMHNQIQFNFTINRNPILFNFICKCEHFLLNFNNECHQTTSTFTKAFILLCFA